MNVLKRIAIDDGARLASFPFSTVPMRLSARKNFAALYVAACSATSIGNSGGDPKLDLVLHGRSVHDQKISGVGAGHEHDSGVPGLKQIFAPISSDIG